MLIFAHPDDEVIALGARLGRMVSAHLVHATDGAPRNGEDCRAHGFTTLDTYCQARRDELRRAMEIAGLPDSGFECLDIPDQEAALNLRSLAEAILRRLRDRQPEVVFTHPYEGGHPDHDACAFALHSAARLLQDEGEPAPIILECAFYHAGPEGIVTGNLLPHPESTETLTYRLSPAEILQKQALLACFLTQQATLKYLQTDTESFRIAPEYDFTHPPHAGPVFYDRFPWGMTSSRFSQLASEAEANLFVQEAVDA